MFGVDFSELMLILVIALIVIGPERLPKVARTLGHLWGRAQRYVNGVKSDIARDLSIEEFRQLQQKVQQEAMSVEQTLRQASQTVNQHVQEINNTAMGRNADNKPAQTTELPPPEDQKNFPVD
jgi:sec-independent protein translocase protein TatB